jgi:hypothetical protein
MNRSILYVIVISFIFATLNTSCEKTYYNSAEIDALKVSVSALQKRSDSLAAALSGTNINLGNLTKSVDSIKSQLASIIIQLGQLNSQLITMNANISSITDQIKLLNQQYADLLLKLNAILAQLAITPTTLSNGLVGWFPFTGNAIDSSGYGNNAIVYGATLTTDRFGNSNGAYNFNNTYILIPNSANYAFTNFSISFWLNTTSTNIQVPIKKNTYQNAANEQFSFALNDLNPSSVQFSCKFNNPSCTPGLGWIKNEKVKSILDGKYHHIVGTANGNKINLWLDGVLINSITGPTSSVSSCFNGDIQVGREWSSFNNYFIGKIDDIRIYNRSLTDAEIIFLSSH